jgi:GT2 family glycosyltransferase
MTSPFDAACGQSATAAPARGMARDERGTCVLVVGMHRSGTSAVAGALGRLGLGLPHAEDLLGVQHGNPTGHFESRALIALGDELLERLGASWEHPPPLGGDLAVDPRLAPLRRRAAATFEAAFGNSAGPVCWKDPRTALLLSFWRVAIERPLVGVLVHREPLEVATSLARRDALPLVDGLALWEHYVHAALDGLAGLPVLVVDYPRAVEAPEAFVERVTDFLGKQIPGFDPSPKARAQSAASIRHDLRHRASSPPAASGRLGAVGPERLAAGLVPAEMIALDDELRRLEGDHDAFTAAPPPRSPWGEALIEARRHLLQSWRALRRLAEELARLAQARPVAEEELESALPLLGRALSALPDATAPPPPPPYPLDATEDTAAYHRWLRARGEPIRRHGRGDPPVRRAATRPPRSGRPPRFSVLVPVHRPPLWALQHCLGSVLEQSFPSFELCVCDDAPGEPAVAAELARLARADRRIRLAPAPAEPGIAEATNAALRLASGEWVVFLDHDDELAPDALARIDEAIRATPGAVLCYSDEDKIDEDGLRTQPTLKPGWSPDLLLSNAYLCHLLAVRRDLLVALGGLRSAFDGAQDYDLMLRATDDPSAVVAHAPAILYHWRTLPGSSAGGSASKDWAFDASARALADACARRGIDAELVPHPMLRGSFHLRRRVRGDPLVSVVVPFRDEPALLERCVRSLLAAPGHARVEVVLVDNDSTLPETAAVLAELAEDRRVRTVRSPGPFRWAAVNDAGVRASSGELLLFCNNDVEALSEGWLAALVAHAQRPEVGAVGARLLYPDGRVQHAGVALPLGFAAGHLLHDLPRDAPGYLGLAVLTHDCSAVTGACLMTRRELYEELGGFDPAFPVAYGDIDFCLRLRERGLLVVYTPLAELVHHESRSRGHTNDAAEIAEFHRRWGHVILAGDPYLHPNLSPFAVHCRLRNEEDEPLWKTLRSMLETPRNG